MNLAQSNKKAFLITGGICIAGIWIGMAVIHQKRVKRDELATAFFSELERDISPAMVGLVENKAFDLNYWQTISIKLKKSLLYLTSSSAQSFAKDIRSSFGLFNNTDKIKSVFRVLKDYVQVSQVAFQYYYASPDKINLIDDLKAHLSSSDVGEILDIVKKMPEYRAKEQKR